LDAKYPYHVFRTCSLLAPYSNYSEVSSIHLPFAFNGTSYFFVMDDIRHYDLTILWHQVGLEVETIKISKDAMPEDKAPECPAAPFEG